MLLAEARVYLLQSVEITRQSVFTCNVKAVWSQWHIEFKQRRYKLYVILSKSDFFVWWPKIFQQKKKKKGSRKKKYLLKKDPCVDYWLTLTVLLPTWGSQWFVSGMAELLSGRRAYVTGAADNTWVLSRGPGEWPGSLRETERSPQPTASAHGGLRGSIYCWDWEHKFVLLAFRSSM